MFRNRQVSIRLQKDTTPEHESITFEEDLHRKEVFTRFCQKIAITGALAVYGYVLLDTFRQVKVAQNTYVQDTD